MLVVDLSVEIRFRSVTSAVPGCNIHDCRKVACVDEMRGGRRRRRLLPTFALLYGFASLHLRYVDWRACFSVSSHVTRFKKFFSSPKHGDGWGAWLDIQTCGSSDVLCAKTLRFDREGENSYCYIYTWDGPSGVWWDTALGSIILFISISSPGDDAELLISAEIFWAIGEWFGRERVRTIASVLGKDSMPFCTRCNHGSRDLAIRHGLSQFAAFPFSGYEPVWTSFFLLREPAPRRGLATSSGACLNFGKRGYWV